MTPHQHKRGHAVGAQAAALLRRWGWLLPLALAIVGLGLALGTDDHRLASRSAAVLLLTWALASLLAVAG
jgi:ABC-type transport system involved in cytochrome c biogenesis permease component